MSDNSKIYEIAGGEIAVWQEPLGVICLKVNNTFNDPVELGEHEALALSALLARLAKGLPEA